MARQSRQDPRVRDYILRHVADYPQRIGALTAKEFGLSRTAVAGYMQRLIADGLLQAEGKTRARRYQLAKIAALSFVIDISRGLSEDAVWRFRILPHIKNAKQNVVDLCHYGFTEMLNNAIDHSGSFKALLSYEQDHNEIKMMVVDFGIGVFQKIQRHFNLPDARSALLELSKGKLTSDSERHSGEGIFFTSRMFDRFSISSAGLYYSRERKDEDEWLMESTDVEATQGTCVIMTISTDAQWTTRDVFDGYQGDDLRFRKTHVPIKLSRYPGEQLVSRSQAKRVLARFDDFSEVFLDFANVQDIGQAFADEIFRVFKNAHPEIALYAVNTSPEIDRMIAYVTTANKADGT